MARCLALSQQNCCNVSMATTNHQVSALLEKLIAQADTQDRLSIDDLLKSFRGRANAPLLFLLAILLMTIGGLPLVAPLLGGMIALIAVQGVLGKRLWIPRWLRRRDMAAGKAARLLKKAVPWVKKTEAMTHPRLTYFIRSPWDKIALGIISLMGLSVFALSIIPGALFAPGMAVAALSLARFQRDGVWMLLGLASSAIALALLVEAAR